jgi:hypothetical protein
MENKDMKTEVIEEDTTGKLDRCISEMFYLVDHPRDEVTYQTLKHHAEDMVLAGKEILKRLGQSEIPSSSEEQFKSWVEMPDKDVST